MSFQGRKNAYVCDCGERFVTVDLDVGTTPFIVKCKKCGGRAQSCLYRIPQDEEHDFEWYKPRYADIVEKGPEIRDHVARGGLLLRPRTVQPVDTKV